VADESRLPDEQERLELIPDLSYESRYEFVARLVYKLWVQRGPCGFAGRRLVCRRTGCVRIFSSVWGNIPILECRAGHEKRDLPLDAWRLGEITMRSREFRRFDDR